MAVCSVSCGTQVVRYLDDRSAVDGSKADVDASKAAPAATATASVSPSTPEPVGLPVVVQTPLQAVDGAAMDETCSPTRLSSSVTNAAMTSPGSPSHLPSSTPAMTTPQHGQPQPQPCVSDAGGAGAGAAAAPPAAKRQRLFLDETMPSFFRRLAWSPDGSLLITPGGLVMGDASSASSSGSATAAAAVPNVASVTHVFARDAFARWAVPW